MLLFLNILTLLYIVLGLVLVIGWYVSADYFEKVYDVFFFFTPFICIPSLGFSVFLGVGFFIMPPESLRVMCTIPAFYVIFLCAVMAICFLIDLLARGKSYFESKRGR